ncbi:MAG: LysM peptidoglycan-binding domain-containing protein, partial [Enterovibrio sp.]
HQQNIANAVYKGVLRYFEQAPPDGTLLAAIKNGVNHKVKSGESLSIIAQKYGTSVLAIKTINKLESNVIRIGQVLKIPNIDIKSLAANKNSPEQACSWLMECS